MNQLYFGDNLDVLRRYIPSESVALIYLDPPFNSKQDYNVLFKEHSGLKSAAQIRAFDDTWHWDEAAAASFLDIVQNSPPRVVDAMRAFEALLGKNDMLAYLAMMAPRLVELHRVLKPSGSIYLHCDPTASHYLKILLDGVFAPSRYRNEIVWKRTPFAGSSKARARQYPRSHDVLLFYTKGDDWTWNAPTTPYTEEYLKRFKWDDGDGRGPYRKTLLKTYSKETFERLRTDNRLIAPVKEGAGWSYKQYLSESSGQRQIDDTWIDVNAINPVANERLGYPTQKPEALLERIIAASSNPGDVVLDPFCGCGTAIAVAQKLGRSWIGIDITHLAISLMKHRLHDAFGDAVKYKVQGEPTDHDGATALAQEDRYNFQFWALGLVGARPAEEKKGTDRGIDGRLFFQDDNTGAIKQVIFSVKSGHLKPEYVRELPGILTRERAQIGVLITLEEPSRQMRSDAASQGRYVSPGWNTSHPRIQILTIRELLDGKKVDAPPSRHASVTYRKAPKAKSGGEGEQLTLNP